MQSALVVARDSHEQPDTSEIAALADAAGYDVVCEATQRRREDAAFVVGEGKAHELAREVSDCEVDALVFDQAITPSQYRNLVGLVPEGTAVLDRHRLVLDIFAEQSGTRAARLQVELAQLRYELQFLRATEERTHLQEAAETGSRVVDHERRIRTVERKLDEVVDEAARRRADRREEGFDLVALAGYTNAGKSTLLHRLADDLAVADLDPDHDDVAPEAAVADRLFETLETTTRRATIDDRRVLVTDTVGFAADLPHDLVAAFRPTLSAVADADVGVLVVDATDPVPALCEKVETTLAAVADHRPRGDLVVALNKVDAVGDDALSERRDALAALDVEFDDGSDVDGDVDGNDGDVDGNDDVAAGLDADVLPVSALAGDGVDALRDRIAAGLPTERATFDLPNDGDAQSLLSWAYDRGRVEDVAYEGDRLRFAFASRPSVVERARGRADAAREG